MAGYGPQWKALNTSQPNVSGLLQVAQSGINKAGDAAAGILERYDDGQKTKGDQELARLMANATNQEELGALVNSEEVRGLRLSDNGVKMLNQAQGNRVDWMDTRGRLANDTNNTNSMISDRSGRLGLARNQDARFQGEYDDANRIRDRAWQDDVAIRGAAGDIQRAQDFRRQNGDVVGPIQETGGNAFENYIGNTIQSESGGRSDAKNPKSSATGLGQFTTGTWSDMMRNHPELGLTAEGRTDSAQSERALRQFTRNNMSALENANIPVTEGNLYAAHFLGAGGARSVLTRNDNEQLTNILPASVIEANPFLQGMSVGRFREWSSEKGGGGTRTRNTPSMDVRDQLIAAGLSSTQIDDALNPARTAGEARSAELTAEQNRIDADVVLQSATQANRDLLDNPEITSEREMREAIFADSRFTPTENEQRLEQVQAQIGADPTQLNPAVPESALAETSAIVDTTLAAAERANESNPIDALLSDSRTLAAGESGTVGANVAERLKLGNDGQSPTSITGLREEVGFDTDRLDVMIEDAARRNGVTPEIAGAAMIRAFKRDPWGRNTLENRFDSDTVDGIIGELDQNNQRSFDERRANVQVMRTQMEQAKTQESIIRSQISQYPEGSEQREALIAQLDAVQKSIGQIENRLSNSTTQRAQPRE